MKAIVSANTRLMINSMLVGAVVSMFFLVASMRPQILTENPLLALQMVLAVPFLVTACITSSYLGPKKTRALWYHFGWVMFIVGYAFTLNSIGIIITLITSVSIGLIFFLASCFLAVLYSFMLVFFEKKNIIERLIKDFVFITILVIMGILVILGYVG